MTVASLRSHTPRYYDRLFPANLMVRWLGYGTQHEESTSANLLHRREFSFTTGDEVYIRYLSYDDAAALKKDLVSKLPHKIDIGAIFSAAPRDHKKFKLFEPHQREFIIDIDLTDCARTRASRPHWTRVAKHRRSSPLAARVLLPQTTFSTSTSSGWRRATASGR